MLVELSYFEGYTRDEISKMLNIPLGTVKTRLRAALLQLRELVKIKVNIQAYIESGIIESYVLGLADADESAELEMLCQQHPEIQAALTNFGNANRKEAFNNAIAPPPELKDRLMDMLEQDFKEQNDSKKIPRR